MYYPQVPKLPRRWDTLHQAQTKGLLEATLQSSDAATVNYTSRCSQCNKRSRHHQTGHFTFDKFHYFTILTSVFDYLNKQQIKRLLVLIIIIPLFLLIAALIIGIVFFSAYKPQP
jgi:hypothetical protein